jgi:hypothetical protein
MTKPIRIIVAGSRDFTDYSLLKKKLNHLTSKLDKKRLILVSGANKRGGDKLGEQWAWENGITVERHHPDYGRWPGKVAPIKRNEEMSLIKPKPICCVAFWDGSSPGTADMIEQARKQGIRVKIIRFTNGR